MKNNDKTPEQKMEERAINLALIFAGFILGSVIILVGSLVIAAARWILGV